MVLTVLPAHSVSFVMVVYCNMMIFKKINISLGG